MKLYIMFDGVGPLHKINLKGEQKIYGKPLVSKKRRETKSEQKSGEKPKVYGKPLVSKKLWETESEQKSDENHRWGKKVVGNQK